MSKKDVICFGLKAEAKKYLQKTEKCDNILFIVEAALEVKIFSLYGCATVTLVEHAAVNRGGVGSSPSRGG